jgi:hypothetical protein
VAGQHGQPVVIAAQPGLDQRDGGQHRVGVRLVHDAHHAAAVLYVQEWRDAARVPIPGAPAPGTAARFRPLVRRTSALRP